MSDTLNLPTERHPFKPFIPKDSAYIIVGSLPPIKLTKKIESNIAKLGIEPLYAVYFNNARNAVNHKDIDFYYGSSDNLLWGLLSKVFEVELSTKEQVTTFLEDKAIAVTDVCETVSRRIAKNGLNSSDNDLVVHEWRDLDSTISRSKLERIISTSKWVTDAIQTHFPKINIPIMTLPSPSKSGSRAIGRQADYKAFKKNNPHKNTLDYRILKYKELLKPILDEK
jgi:G:T/U-mismatch repair DNA glycosylase